MPLLIRIHEEVVNKLVIFNTTIRDSVIKNKCCRRVYSDGNWLAKVKEILAKYYAFHKYIHPPPLLHHYNHHPLIVCLLFFIVLLLVDFGFYFTLTPSTPPAFGPWSEYE